ncbi:MAG: SEFIR domain-containing protein [Methylocella sp.]
MISYGHDTPEHAQQVLQLANPLRGHGVEVEVDYYHVRPPHGWPRWCEQQLHPEKAAIARVICSKTYRQQAEGKTPADERRGVLREGGIIFSNLYSDKANKNFIPILLTGAPEEDIPRPLRDGRW